MVNKGGQEKRDWFKTCVHFAFGAILGAVLGIGSLLWLTEADSALLFVLVLFGSSVSVGLLAGAFTDRFWKWFTEEGGWRWWPR